MDKDPRDLETSARDRQQSVPKITGQMEHFPLKPEGSVDGVRSRERPESSDVVANSDKADSSVDHATLDHTAKLQDMDEDGDHVVEGDEDTVIY